jgi:hypothetical protein
MSASNLFNINGDLSIQSAVSAPATSATLTTSASSLVVVFAGEAVLPIATPSSSLVVAVPGVLATDLVITTVNGSATPANLLLAVAGVATADTVTFTTGVVATNTLAVGFLVLRPNA